MSNNQNGGAPAKEPADPQARIAELEAENKSLTEKLAAADEEIAALRQQVTAASAAAQDKAVADLPEREPVREFTKEELSLAKKLGIRPDYILKVNLKSGVIVTVDGRKVRKGGDE